MVGRPGPTRATRVGKRRETLAPFVAVPVFDIPETRPDGVDRMLLIGTEVSELARKNRGASARIDDPPAADRFLAAVACDRYRSRVAIKIEAGQFRWPPQLATSGGSLLQHVLVERRAIDLEGR